MSSNPAPWFSAYSIHRIARSPWIQVDAGRIVHTKWVRRASRRVLVRFRLVGDLRLCAQMIDEKALERNLCAEGRTGHRGDSGRVIVIDFEL